MQPLPSHEYHSYGNHKKKAGTEHSEENSWAVSYSDLLMVLISFFIVFFSISDDSEKGILNEIVLSLKSEIGVHEVDAGTKKAISKSTKTESKSLLSGFNTLKEKKKVEPSTDKTSLVQASQLARELTVSKLFKDSSMAVSSNRGLAGQSGTIGDVVQDSIVIDFPDNSYDLGQYKLIGSARLKMDSLLNILKSSKEKIKIIVVGHSDVTPVSKNRKVVDSNFVLSSLRATKAVEYIVKRGFSPEFVLAQGSSRFSRSTRSISVKVVSR